MGGIPECFEDRWGVLWCSGALRSTPLRKGEHRKSVHIWMSVKFGITKLWFSPSQTEYPSVDHGDFRNTDQRMRGGMEQRQMRVAVSAAVVCLRGANPSSTEILITTTPLTTLYTSNLIHQSSILHSHSSNQITSFTSFS